jgi:hypothetical protein
MNWVLSLFLAVALSSPATVPATSPAEETFFRAFNHNPKLRPQAHKQLLGAYARNAGDPRTTLLLGLSHLWTAAEGDRTNPERIENLLLAKHYLERAEKLDPIDRRIPSWLVPVRMNLAQLERNGEARQQLWAEMMVAYKEDPNFHSFTLALLSYNRPRGSADFKVGLDALRATVGCNETADVSCGNRPRWPHNQEGFLAFQADYELKAGNVAEARALLEVVKKIPEYPTFAFPQEIEDRLANLDTYAALYANADAGDDPPPIIHGTMTCQVCHMTK